jgi:hypothetical protein
LTFVAPPSIPPGVGFFIQNPNGPETNTYVGSVILTSTNLVAGGGAQSLISSQLPVAGNVETNTTLNLPLQGGETLLVWAGTGYYVYEYAAGAVTGSGAPSDWYDGGGAPIPGGVYNASFGLTFVAAPVLGVGQALFYQNPNPGTNWIQNLSVQ